MRVQADNRQFFSVYISHSQRHKRENEKGTTYVQLVPYYRL